MKTLHKAFDLLHMERQRCASHRVLLVLHLFLLATVLLGLPAASTAQEDWTTIGSAGLVDEADRGKILFDGSIVTFKPGAEGMLNLRYNVVAVDGLFGGDGVELGVRFRDNGSDARVVVRLRRYALEPGESTTLLTLNSNNFGPQENFQLRTEVDCSLRFNFFDYAYFLDVTLTKTGDAATPALGVIQLASVLCGRSQDAAPSDGPQGRGGRT